MLPAGILKTVDLKSPATTVALLKMNAIVGIQADRRRGQSHHALGVTCALCHSTVDDSRHAGDRSPQRRLAEPRSQRRGDHCALARADGAAEGRVLSWGPGKYDPRYNKDGKNTPLVIPPAYGLAQIKNETYTAEGPLSYWNAYVAVTQMGGRGTSPIRGSGSTSRTHPTWSAPSSRRCARISIACRYRARRRRASIARAPRAAAPLFNRNCATCHVGGSGTDNNSGKLHKPAEIGMDGAYAARTVNKAYRTTPLRGLCAASPVLS